ncbi:winged helix-turn-helix transcriptional regulator [Shimazuella alba]|uniref:Transcriptional regulator n=1 Tax=Shimazuella alba TaxID=2690964 RepID=A0A6I4VTJ2_9BACL|nr:helix-turn-helix domain-containing protein [Shimazuella alba]MXQ53818.1 transcriptional regulator [Shimazuella alba]
MRTLEEEELNPPICEVLQILRAKWTHSVFVELYKGPKRFKQLQRIVPFIKTQSLTDVLRHLEQFGIVERKVFPTVPITVEYSLSEKGMDFQNVLQGMDEWASKWRQ